MPSIAECFLRLRVDESQVKSDVERGLDRVDTGTSGSRAGKSFGAAAGAEGSKGISDALKTADWVTPGKDGGRRTGTGFVSSFLSSFRGMAPSFNKAFSSVGEEGATAMSGALDSGLSSGPLGIGAIIGAALVAAPGVFAVAGSLGAVALGSAFAVKGSAELQKQGKVLLGDLSRTMTSASSVLIQPVSQAMGYLAGELPTLRGLLATTFTDVAPLLKPMVQMLVDMVNNTLPGFNTLMAAARVPLTQFFNTAGLIVGTNLGKFFADLAPAVGQSVPFLESLLSITMEFLPALANLADVLTSLPRYFNDVTAAMDRLKGPASVLQPILDGMTWLQNHLPAGNKTILDLAAGAGHASTSLHATATQMQQAALRAAEAAPKVGTLSGDMALLNSTTASASTQLSAYNNMWNLIIGRSLAQQSAVLADKAAFDNLRNSMRTTGAQSTASRQAFVAFIQQVGTSIGTLMQNGASVRTINAAYLDSIHKLQSLHGLNATQRADIAGVIRDYTAWTHTTDGLNTSIVNASHTLENQFIAHMQQIHHDSPAVNADVSNFADSILKTGTRSAQTASDRRRLIDDIVKAGGSASTAKRLVDDLQRSITGLHGKVATVTVDLAGMGGLRTVAKGNLPSVAKANQLILEGRAMGGPITGPGGPRSDMIPIWASNGEFVMQADAVKRYGLPFMHALNAQRFATGGQITSDLNTAMSWTQWQGQQFVSAAANQWGNALVAYLQQFLGPGANAGYTPGGALSGSARAAQAFARAHLADYGWGAGQWPALLALWNQESGWNANAVNPSSGAYGIPQALGHGHPYNLGDYANQIRWGLAYIFARYGSPNAAWAHERANNWYASGGTVREPVFGIGARSGQTYTFGEAGSELVSGQADMQAVARRLDRTNALLERIPGAFAGALKARRGMEAQAARLGLS